MPFKKGRSMRWYHHDTFETALLSLNLAMHMAMQHTNVTTLIHPGAMSALEYNDVMIKKHRKDVIQAVIDKIALICIIAGHCPKLRPTTVDMTEAMYSLLIGPTARRVLC